MLFGQGHNEGMYVRQPTTVVQAKCHTHPLKHSDVNFRYLDRLFAHDQRCITP
jgi:hypothetical protein